MAGQKSKNQKRTHKVKADRQWARTAKNTAKRRSKRAKAHPNDKQAPRDWIAHPIKYSK